MRSCILFASLHNAHLALAGSSDAGSTCGQAKSLYKAAECCGAPESNLGHSIIPAPTKGLFKSATNPCAGAKEKYKGFDNVACFVDDVVQAVEQSGADVSETYNTDREFPGIDAKQNPWTEPYSKGGLCPVNVHWHLGAEHRSAGEYDETFNDKGPPASRRLADGDAPRLGFRCKHYDANDKKFTTPYNWLHCDASMKVGETYEIHWPHSAAGLCGTPFQYQTPFYDGVLCVDGAVDLVFTQKKLNLSHAVGVQGQVFTIVNDEAYYYPDLMRGMIFDTASDMGQKITAYTGSTTGTTRNNEVCSKYAPITWQVDRKCHLISASSFDKLCADMKQQADDMSSDLHAHGARELVADKLAANNQVFDASVGR